MSRKLCIFPLIQIPSTLCLFHKIKDMKTNRKNESLINFGVLLRKLRIQRGYKSAETFSYEFELNRTAYWRWENGENITMNNFFRLCEIHQKTPMEIFELMEY